MENQKIASSNIRKSLIMIVILFSVISFAILLVCSLLIVFVFTRNRNCEDKTRTESNVHYRYHQFHTEEGESRIGYITLPKDLELDSLSYFEKETSSHILISAIDLQEYRCEGSCFCTEPSDEYSNQSKRRYSYAISKPLTLFVAAVTSLLAFNVAKDNFRYQCEESLSDICSTESVMSEIDQCEPVLSETSDEEENGKSNMEDIDDKSVEKDYDYVIGFITHPNFEEAKMLAEKLVENQLVACVSIVPKIYSIYSWKGNIEKDEEVLMLVKTKVELKEKVIEFVIEHHPYECPEVVFTDIKSGFKDYLSWIGDQTKKV